MPTSPPAPGSAAPCFRPANPVVIGLLGGVAAGKSSVARLFAARGLRHVDADAESRVVSTEPTVLQELAAEFGGDVVVDGSLDRGRLAAIVFSDPHRRTRAEAILHPRIRARILAAIAAARAAGDSVLLDAPLLLEGGLVELCDHTLFVDAAHATRIARAAARGWSPGELERREAAQLPLAVKMARASHTICNDAGLEATAEQVDAWLRELAADDRSPHRGP
jgi:dephospho-CoA kinase